MERTDKSGEWVNITQNGWVGLKGEWEKIFQGGTWLERGQPNFKQGIVTLDVNMSCPVLFYFFPPFILSKILDLNCSWEELGSMDFSSKARTYLSYVRKEIKTPIFKNPIKKSKFNLN